MCVYPAGGEGGEEAGEASGATLPSSEYVANRVGLPRKTSNGFGVKVGWGGGRMHEGTCPVDGAPSFSGTDTQLRKPALLAAPPYT